MVLSLPRKGGPSQRERHKRKLCLCLRPDHLPTTGHNGSPRLVSHLDLEYCPLRTTKTSAPTQDVNVAGLVATGSQVRLPPCHPTPHANDLCRDWVSKCLGMMTDLNRAEAQAAAPKTVARDMLPLRAFHYQPRLLVTMSSMHRPIICLRLTRRNIKART